jgi:hypothetical protein
MEISDSEATFLAEALGEFPDKKRAIGFLNTFVRCPSAVVREGALLGLATIMRCDQITRDDCSNCVAARDLIRIVAKYDTDKYLREMAERILSS